MTTIDALSAFNGGVGKPVTANDAGAADRFLKLLVTQMQNQDPLNPMDNAQITSKMAQINTVSGIDKLNTSVQGLSTQFRQMQALQGASLVGRDITLNGNQLSVQGGVGVGGFELSGTADSVGGALGTDLGPSAEPRALRVRACTPSLASCSATDTAASVSIVSASPAGGSAARPPPATGTS